MPAVKGLKSDITVVGGGIAGLWSAKALIDNGYSVNLIEKSPTLAAGATTRNEGWLHAGTYHSVAIYDEVDAQNVTARTMYGHEAIVDFAPESIEQDRTFAFAADEQLAADALIKWGRFGVVFREVSKAQFEDEGFDTARIKAAFEVADVIVNSRIICSKLARYVIERGGRIITNADFIPTSSTTADIVKDDETTTITSDCFVIAAGTGTKQIFESLRNGSNRFPMRFFKSHLLVTPRLTDANYFYLDPLEAGVMSHGDTSIVGINREALEVTTPDYSVIPPTAKLVYESMRRMLPRFSQYQLDSPAVMSVACIKTDMHDEHRTVMPGTNVFVQDLNIKVFEPDKNYICAIPGKMTEAPALARTVVEYVQGKEIVSAATEGDLNPDNVIEINLRPADQLVLSEEAA